MKRRGNFCVFPLTVMGIHGKGSKSCLNVCVCVTKESPHLPVSGITVDSLITLPSRPLQPIKSRE
ncbi:hypothetical protein E2C01_031267 [Portunus trituberculatus]|uniref:Uncharacterized protein n=1 Tax=Portunus trituberculatus TaxID=210409 RepID=A0A5B7EX59_PORTR|nr:hypothetical protein [Portunus trituberculatus]